MKLNRQQSFKKNHQRSKSKKKAWKNSKFPIRIYDFIAYHNLFIQFW